MTLFSAKNPNFVSLSTGTIIRFFAVLLTLLLIYVIRDLIAALVFAVIVASAFEPVVAWFQKHGLSRIAGVVVVYLVIGILFFLMVYLIFPLLLEEATAILETYPVFRERILSGISTYSERFPFLMDNLPTLVQDQARYLGILSASVADVSSAVFGGAYTLILIFI